MQGRIALLLGALGVAALFILRPALENQYLHQSWWMDWVWLDQFSRQMLAGDLYPRWLADSHGGLGSPTFFFYPPLPFWLGSAFSALGLDTYAALVATFALAVILCALSAHAWFCAMGQRAVLPALLYAAAPYFCLDILHRGALNELYGYAFVPLVALGMLRAYQRKGGVVLAPAVALLLYSHLPIALLSLLFLVLPYALLLSRDPRDWVRMAWPFALGLLIAAPFVVPALFLEDYRFTEQLWGSRFFQPEYWNLLFRRMDDFVQPVALLIAVSFVASLLMFLVTRKIAALIAAAAALLSFGVLPLLFELPLLSKIQFPFRAAGFSALWMAYVVAREKSLGPRLLVVAALPSLATVYLLADDVREDTPDAAYFATYHPDVTEMLPPSAPKEDWRGHGYTDARLVRRFADDPLVAPVYFFPIWEARCDTVRRPVALDDSGLVRLPDENCTIVRRILPVEIAAWAAALLGIAAMAWLWNRNRNLVRRR